MPQVCPENCNTAVCSSQIPSGSCEKKLHPEPTVDHISHTYTRRQHATTECCITTMHGEHSSNNTIIHGHAINTTVRMGQPDPQDCHLGHKTQSEKALKSKAREKPAVIPWVQEALAGQ
jgi:hypothetical protein